MDKIAGKLTVLGGTILNWCFWESIGENVSYM